MKANNLFRMAGLTLTALALIYSPRTASAQTVLQLQANGSDPYAYFASKDLDPIDGPSSGYIFDNGSYFRFVLHQDGAEETVSSGAVRQRNELTVNPGNSDSYKAFPGDTVSYTWRFRITTMNADPTWCTVFQLKQHGTSGTGPYGALQCDGANFLIYVARAGGTVKTVPLSSVMGVWINATLQAHFTQTGSISFTLKKDDGTTVMSYSNNNVDLTDDLVDFVRPKWGMYRNKADGAGEAAVDYNNMTIIRGPLPSNVTLDTTGIYQLQNVASGLVLNNQGSLTNGSKITQWASSSTSDNLRWKFIATDSGYYQINSVKSTKDATVQGASTTAGAGIIQWSFGSAQNDQWKPTLNSDGSYTFVNRHSGLVLEDPGSSTSTSAQMDQWTANGGANQKWKLLKQ